MRIILAFLVALALACGALAQAQPAGRIAVGAAVGADRFEAAQAAGFDYVEVGAARVAALTEEEFQHLAEQVAGLRIPVAAANSFIPSEVKLVGADIDKGRQETYVGHALRRLKRLGVSVVVLGSGAARRVPEGFARQEAFDQLVDFCRRIAPVARENGITIAIEPLRRQESNIINTAREGLALVRAVDRPEIKLLVDFYHLSEEGESPGIVLEAGKQIVHVHVANPKGRVFPLSAGEAAYAPFFDNLCRIGYSGRVSIEASTPDFTAEAPRSIAMLRGALACNSRDKH
ncbi:MAG TPA: sugar phosphate isomerase/epimerase family protein [Vicinamibacterales bacterium]|nr:sugar phosphate isomerase/epimerase family protein [Vicinamibacterales bacterium]